MFQRIASEDGRVRLHLKGSMDGPQWLALRSGFEALSSAPVGDVVLDLSNVTFIDGPGVAAIGFLFKRLRAKGRRLVMAGVGGQPLALLRDHGLARIMGLPVERMPEPRRAITWAWAR